jgi:epsilon-lactone hydrolase
VVEPQGGISAANRKRVLINLHGGGFMLGARYGGQQESIPIASLGKFKVITADYRLAPENKFQAGSEDVAAVYRALLKQYLPSNIGIYGCSAGSLLTAEAVAWFQKHGLPRPGAIGLFGEGAVTELGESNYIQSALGGGRPSGRKTRRSGATSISRITSTPSRRHSSSMSPTVRSSASVVSSDA